VIGARVEVGLDAVADHLLVAPRHDRIDEPVAAAVLEVGVGEAEPREVVAVVGQAEIDQHVLARDRARLRGVALEQHHLLRAQPRALAQDLPRARGVLGRHEVGMGALRGVAREREHVRAQRCEHDRRGLGG
jgi:hypothetical protein